MKGTKSEQTELRDEALYAAYKEALASSKAVDHNEAVRIALQSPQPRMWVSFYGVYRALLRIVRNSREAPKGESRKHLLAEVERKYNELIKRRAFKDASLFFIASFIIAEPSTGFYLSEARAKRIIWGVRKKKRMAWVKRI